MGKKGCLVLVVGPSGAGKDTLIEGARLRFAGDTRFVFPHRLITRPSLPEAEVHETISRAEFDAMLKSGAYGLAWQAHGLGYIIPAWVADAVADGRIAVCNTSRGVIAQAVARFAQTHVFYIDAMPEIRAGRLAARGRESAEEIAGRVSREVPMLSGDVPVTSLDNSGTMEEGIACFTAALIRVAATPMNERQST